MADYTQSATQTIIAHSALTHPAMLEGTPVAVATFLSGVITVKVANVEVTANATGVMVWIQGSFETTGDDAWFDLITFTGTTTAAETEAMTATEPVAETSIACASTTNLVVGDWIYLQDASVVADGEWHKIVKVVTNTSITIDYGLAVQKDSSDFIWTEADVWTAHINCEGLKRVNVLVVHEAATGSNLHVLAEGVFATDIE
jgi:type IV secretory pathway VirB3-like protein